MEDGSVTSGGSNGGLHDISRRRSKTVSGALRPKDHEKDHNTTSTQAMKLPWTSPSVPSSPTTSESPGLQKSPSHRRTFSAGLLQKFNFLRGGGSTEDGRPSSRDKEPPKSPESVKSRKSIDDDPPTTLPSSTSNKLENSMAFALRPVKTRKRKGSLRKTALLGGKRIMSEGRERNNSFTAKSPLSKVPLQQTKQPQEVFTVPDEPVDLSDSNAIPVVGPTYGPRRQFSYENSTTPNGTGSVWSESPAIMATRLSLVTEHDKKQPETTTTSPTTLTSPVDVKSPASNTSYASTTDDDEVLTFDRPAAKNSLEQAKGIIPKPLPSSTSYFPSSDSSTSSLSLPQHQLANTLLNNKHGHPKRSPLSHTISSSSLYSATSHPPPPHSYQETEYWGWVILVITWLTFTVGMGSCLDIWSWAWDVGERPYAPYELEDDATLPIVGYYPALIVLTGGVVVWAWITVAWVGMKYFRHARVEV